MTHRILLVEDDPDVREVLACVLTNDGHTVVTANDGNGGLRVLEAETVDLIVTDVIMPDMEGIQFLRLLRRMPTRPKVIVISGGGRGSANGYLELATTLGADGTLPKPIAATDLRDLIAHVMNEPS